MKKKETLKITIITGDEVTVDISDKACLEFGFKHGDDIITPVGDEAIVMGVGSFYSARKTLWYITKGQKGACHYGQGNLREAAAIGSRHSPED